MGFLCLSGCSAPAFDGGAPGVSGPFSGGGGVSQGGSGQAPVLIWVSSEEAVDGYVVYEVSERPFVRLGEVHGGATAFPLGGLHGRGAFAVASVADGVEGPLSVTLEAVLP